MIPLPLVPSRKGRGDPKDDAVVQKGDLFVTRLQWKLIKSAWRINNLVLPARGGETGLNGK